MSTTAEQVSATPEPEPEPVAASQGRAAPEPVAASQGRAAPRRATSERGTKSPTIVGSTRTSPANANDVPRTPASPTSSRQTRSTTNKGKGKQKQTYVESESEESSDDSDSSYTGSEDSSDYEEEMNSDDDTMSTVTAIHYENLRTQKDLEGKFGVTFVGMDEQEELRKELEVPFTHDNEIQPMTREHVFRLITLYYTLPGNTLENNEFKRKKSLKSKLNVVGKIFDHLEITDWLQLYKNPNKYIEKYINYTGLKNKKNHFSIIGSFSEIIRKVDDLISNLKSESQKTKLRKQLHPICSFDDVDIDKYIPQPALFKYQKWTKIHSRMSNMKQRDNVDKAPYYDFDSIKTYVPQAIRKTDPTLTNFKVLRDLLIVSIYMQYPLRDDLGHVRVVQSENEAVSSKYKNYYIEPENKMVIGQFKYHEDAHESTRQAIKFKLNEEALDIYARYKKAHAKKFKGQKLDYFISNEKNGTYDLLSNYIIVLFKKYTNCYFVPLGISQIRHSWATKYRNAKQKEIEEIAFMMRHNVAVHAKYVRTEKKLRIFLPCSCSSPVNGKQKLPDGFTMECSDPKCKDLVGTAAYMKVPLSSSGKKSTEQAGSSLGVEHFGVLQGSTAKNHPVKFAYTVSGKKNIVELNDTVRILPPGYKPFENVKLTKDNKYKLEYNGKLLSTRLEKNMDQETSVLFPYSATIQYKDRLKRFLVYNYDDMTEFDLIEIPEQKKKKKKRARTDDGEEEDEDDDDDDDEVPSKTSR